MLTLHCLVLRCISSCSGIALKTMTSTSISQSAVRAQDMGTGRTGPRLGLTSRWPRWTSPPHSPLLRCQSASSAAQVTASARASTMQVRPGARVEPGYSCLTSADGNALVQRLAAPVTANVAVSSCCMCCSECRRVACHVADPVPPAASCCIAALQVSQPPRQSPHATRS
jgi:hypothetical protein